MKVNKINLKHPRFNKFLSKLKEGNFKYLKKDLIRPKGYFYYLSDNKGEIVAIGEMYHENGYIFSYIYLYTRIIKKMVILN